MKRFYLITPFLFTFSLVLYINYSVSIVVSPDQVVRLLVGLWLLLGLLVYPAYLVIKDWEWASLLLTIFVFAFYFPQSFFLSLGSVVLIAVILWQVYFRLRRFEVLLRQLFVLLDGIAVFVIAFALYINIRSFTEIPWLEYLQSVEQAKKYSIEIPSTPFTKPDIYYIVLDGYVRSDVLEKLYGYDNAQFIKYLQDRGFIAPDDIHSNYAKTAVSVASTLNMGYIDSFSPGLDDSHFWWLMAPFIDYSRVRATLESQGYKTVSLSTGWGITDNLTTDIYLHPFPIMLTDYERFFFGSTALGYVQPLFKDIASIPTFDTHRRIIKHSFEALMDVPEIAGPKFTFAHITSPHPPFVFDRNGNPINPPGKFNINDADDFYGSTNVYQEGYIEQVEFVNAQMQRVVDTILEKSETPPIIIIQADHGSGLLTDFSSAENTCIKERFSPFAAYYLPGISTEAVPQNLTTVNLFRMIFNHYFQANLPLLENELYYYRDTIYIYRLVNVTSRVNDECVMR